jgi:FkbM family methyltransferase
MKELPFTIKQDTILEKWRVETFWTKEPETLAWIESFIPGESLLDVGANIGLYSLYAASRGCRVLAVEPHIANYASLAINARMNKHCSIKPLRSCIGDRNGIVEFRCPDINSGATGGGYTRSYGQGHPSSVMTIDRIMEIFWQMNYMKIDVDGEENLVVAGMMRSLIKRRFKSCLIEIDMMGRNLDKRNYIYDAFHFAGYSTQNRFNSMTPHSRERRNQEGIQVENVVFTRLD